MSDESKVLWLLQPDEKNYPAALSYLSLLYDEDVAKKHVSDLRNASVVKFKAKDIFRASALSLLGISNSHVENDIRKIKEGIKLSPLLLVRDSANGKLVVADGYHRLCAVYTFNEDSLIPCKIV